MIFSIELTIGCSAPLRVSLVVVFSVVARYNTVGNAAAELGTGVDWCSVPASRTQLAPSRERREEDGQVVLGRALLPPDEPTQPLRNNRCACGERTVGEAAPESSRVSCYKW